MLISLSSMVPMRRISNTCVTSIHTMTKMMMPEKMLAALDSFIKR